MLCKRTWELCVGHCHAVCKAWRNLILRPSSGGGEFGATLWRGHLLRVVHANADLLADADKMEARSPGKGHPRENNAAQQETAQRRRQKLSGRGCQIMSATSCRQTHFEPSFLELNGIL